MAGKRLQLLRELIPTAKRVATLSHPPHPTNARQLEGAETVARALGVKLEAVAVRDADDFDSALKALRGIDGLLHADTPLFTTHRARLAEVVARRRLPTIFAFRGYVDAGGLMSYGADQPDLYRRAATSIDKVLKGAKPADLPVEQPSATTSISLDLVEGPRCCPLDGEPRHFLPGRAGGGRERMLPARREEGAAPALLGVPASATSRDSGRGSTAPSPASWLT